MTDGQRDGSTHYADTNQPHPARQVFALFDDDGTGGITFRNLKRVANELGENLTDEELQEMIGACVGWGGVKGRGVMGSSH